MPGPQARNIPARAGPPSLWVLDLKACRPQLPCLPPQGNFPLPRTQEQPQSSCWAQARLTDPLRASGKSGPGLTFSKRIQCKLLKRFLHTVIHSEMTISLAGVRTRNIPGTFKSMSSCSHCRPHPRHSIPWGALSPCPL